MLKKLIKYEFQSILRILIPIAISLIAMTGVTYIVFSFSYEGIILKLIPGTMTLFYFINIIMLMAASFLFTIYRFYKNLITNEGYLMFTLPVNTGMLLQSKLITALTTQIASVFLCILSLLVIGRAKYSPFRITNFDEVIREFKRLLPINESTLIILILIFFFLSLIFNNLIYYASIALGHSMTKNKILGSILCYWLIYSVTQGISLVLFLVGNVVFEISISLLITLIALLFIIGSIVLYYLSRYYLTNKLNLE